MIDPKQGPFPRLSGRDEAVTSAERPASRSRTRGVRQYGLRWARVQGRWLRDRRTTDDGFATPVAERVQRDAERIAASEEPRGRPARPDVPFDEDVRVAIDDPEEADPIAIDDPDEHLAVPDAWVDEPPLGDRRAAHPRPGP